MSKSLILSLRYNQTLQVLWWQTFTHPLSLLATRMHQRHPRYFLTCPINLREKRNNRKINQAVSFLCIKLRIRKKQRKYEENSLLKQVGDHNFRLQRLMKISKYKFCQPQKIPVNLIKTYIKESIPHLKELM